uniref:Serine protease 1 n=2 Tax=Cyprinus carpio TaxID=7962 RepID=A0A8C1LYB1_CYPCA
MCLWVPMLSDSTKTPALVRSSPTCSVLAAWREARTPARVTLVAQWCAATCCRVLCFGVTAVARGTNLVSLCPRFSIWTVTGLNHLILQLLKN